MTRPRPTARDPRFDRPQRQRYTPHRREFITLLGASALALPLLRCSSPSGNVSGKVVVIGAGLSGLLTAMLLEERGVEVVVVEARNRVGGRVVTAHEVPGEPEAGGPVVGGSYERFLRVAKAVGANLGPGPGFDRTLALHVNGQTVGFENWPSSPANLTVGPERQMPPGRLLGYYAGLNLPLEDADDWISPEFAQYDVPLEDYVRQQGASDEAVRLMNVAPNTNDIATTSALWALSDAYSMTAHAGKGILGVAGGNQAMAEKMAATLKGQVVLGKPVSAIRSAGDSVEVLCDGGETFTGAYCVCTVPFSVLRNIEVDPPFQGTKKEAVEQIPYTPITKYFLVPKTPFWETDGLSASMWTDTFIERVFPFRDAQGAVKNLTVWIDGPNAAKLDGMSEAEQKDAVVKELARIRPTSAGQVDVASVVSWGNDPYALGAYAHWAPGQVTRLQSSVAEPWERIHFAGELTAVYSAGMESAMESAERAAGEVLARLA